MKARIKKTGEIVNIAEYAKIALDQCDSWGNPIEVKIEDVELIQEQTEDEHWQDIRERAAIAAMQGLSANPILFYNNSDEKINITARAIRYANALIEKLKNK
jgi:predicted DNA binding CopG/RHH family protein